MVVWSDEHLADPTDDPREQSTADDWDILRAEKMGGIVVQAMAEPMAV